MRSLRYLNTILTLIAVLLTLNLWTMWTTGPAEQSLTLAAPAHAQGTVSAGQQREDMIRLLKEQVKKTDELKTMLTSGKVRVVVTNIKDAAKD